MLQLQLHPPTSFLWPPFGPHSVWQRGSGPFIIDPQLASGTGPVSALRTITLPCLVAVRQQPSPTLKSLALFPLSLRHVTLEPASRFPAPRPHQSADQPLRRPCPCYSPCYSPTQACRSLITILARPVQPRTLDFPRCNTPRATTHMRENLWTLLSLHTTLLHVRPSLQHTAIRNQQRNTTTHHRLGLTIPAPTPTRPTVECSPTTTTVIPMITHTAAAADMIVQDNIRHTRSTTRTTAITVEEQEGE